MSDKVRRTLIAIGMAALFLMLIQSPMETVSSASNLKDYYMTFFIKDTAAMNAVTGIYLNYRVFDTLFETLTLLISVIGIIYFSRHEGDY